MKRGAVSRRLRRAAKRADKHFEITELTNHTGTIVGETRSTIGRHGEVDDLTVKKFFAQFQGELGQGWWRK